MSYSIDGAATLHPPRVRLRLHQTVAVLLGRYGLDEIMAAIAAQRPDLDINVYPTGIRPPCPKCGVQIRPGYGRKTP